MALWPQKLTGISTRGQIERGAGSLSCSEIGFPEEIMTVVADAVHRLSEDPVNGTKHVTGFGDHAQKIAQIARMCVKDLTNC